jgi:hypothetical protein
LKRVLLVLCLSLIAVEAHAISRYASTSMSCGEVQAIVRRDGAALLRYRSERNPSILRYDRYVADRRFCKSDERAETSFVPTADRRSCPVRKCERVDPDDRFFILRRD